jgi:plasmid replication initiation protein
LKSQYSTRLYQWANPYVAVGYKRVSLATLRKILGLEEIKDNLGRVVEEVPLELWANVKQRALDQALGEINKHSDIELELELTGPGPYRKVQSLGFRIAARKHAKR